MDSITTKISVAAPVYNEEKVIEKVVRYWFEVLQASGLSHEVVLGDGGSTDRTLEILERLREEFPQLRVARVQGAGGYGNALFEAIYKTRGEKVVMLDADGQFDLKDFLPLLQKMEREDLDVVSGFRLRKNDTFLRVYADRVLNFIVRFFFGLDQRDTNCALKVFQGEMIRNLVIEARAWPTPTEIMIRLHTMGWKIGEVGIRHYARAGGETKLNVTRTSLEMISFLVYMKLKLFLYRKKIINSLQPAEFRQGFMDKECS
jgi:glycosyltransferase involved in cell wall biosynthesis